MLIEACRAQLVREKIRAELARGALVLCDRFTDATLAYQGFGRGLDLELIERLNRLACEEIEPDLTFLFDCPVEVGLGRLHGRYQQGGGSGTPGGRPDRLEGEERAFHERVRQGYLSIAAKQAQRILTLDATRQEETVHRAVMQHVREVLRRRETPCPLRESSVRSG